MYQRIHLPQRISSENGEVLRELQRETFVPISIATSGLGLFLILLVSTWVPDADSMKTALIGLVLILTSLLAIYKMQAHYIQSVTLLMVGWILSIIAGMAWFSFPALACLLVLPVVLSTLLIGRWAGFLICAWISLATIFLNNSLHDLPLLLTLDVAVLTGWAVQFTGWLLIRNMNKVVAWSLKNYHSGQQQLEQAREHQGELNQAVKDLADTNLQLARLNQLLHAERQRAEEAERVKTEFTANVSHELRTPLNMIIGFSEAILSVPATYGKRLPTALLADIDAIYRNSQHLANLINDVLDISQIEARRMIINRDWVSLAQVIEEAAQSVSPMLESRSLYLKTNLPAEIPFIYCDKTRIRQILLNLLSNAGRFTESGGITIDATLDEKQVTVTVTDTGLGIPVADLPKLFEPFRQLGGGQRNKHGSSGLGLNISKRFVELHDGKMGAQSQVNGGSSFWFTLPLHPNSPQTGAYGRWLKSDWEPHTTSRLTPKPRLVPRIILLESRSLLEEMARRYLDDVQIECVSEPAEVNACLAKQPAQVILVRGESDEQVSNWVQAIQLTRFQAPIMAVSSAHDDIVDSMGIAAYLLKPITAQKLLASVESIHTPVHSILLVDDNQETLQLYTRILSSRPQRYRVLQANNGLEALELLRSRKPDLIMLDLVMPGMDGYSVLAEMRRDNTLKKIPAIIVSATDPASQPVITSTVSITRTGGFSIPEFLQCAMLLSQALLPDSQNLG